MNGLVCPLCGGEMEEIIIEDGIQCDTCSLIIRSNGYRDYSEMDIEDIDE